MCKKWCGILMAILTLMISSGCTVQSQLGNEKADVYQRLHRKFTKMTSYTANVRVTVLSNKTTQVYEMLQTVKEPDGARLEMSQPESLAGMVTLYHEGKIQIKYKEEAPLTLPGADRIQDVFLQDFFKQYYQSEKTAVSVSGAEDTGTVLLETWAQPETSRRYKLTLLLNTKDLEPVMLTVYDIGGNIRMKVEFTEFCYNPLVEEGLFNF